MSCAIKNSKTVIRLLLLVSLQLLVSACSSGLSLSYTPPTSEETAFDYYQKIKTLTSEELALEQSRIEEDRLINDSAVNTVKLAILLGWEEQAEANAETLAINLLENLQAGVQRETMSVDYKIFSDHWLELLRQRQKMREFTILYQQTLDAQMELQTAYSQLDEKYLGLARILASMEEQNTLLARQNVLMQQQIEALTIIEQQLAEREQTQAQQ